MRCPPPLFSTDKRSLINSALFQPEIPTPMVWSSSIGLDKSFPLMLRRTIWFHTSIQSTLFQTTRICLSNLLRDSSYREPMISSCWCLIKNWQLKTSQVLLRLLKTLQELFSETKRRLTSSSHCPQLEDHHPWLSTSILWSTQQHWIKLSQLNLSDQSFSKEN